MQGRLPPLRLDRSFSADFSSEPSTILEEPPAALYRNPSRIGLVPVRFPGYFPDAPTSLPRQYGKPTVVRVLLEEALTETGMTKAPKLKRFLLSESTGRLFADAYWLIFLHEFHHIDVPEEMRRLHDESDALLKQSPRGNTLLRVTTAPASALDPDTDNSEEKTPPTTPRLNRANTPLHLRIPSPGTPHSARSFSSTLGDSPRSVLGESYTSISTSSTSNRSPPRHVPQSQQSPADASSFLSFCVRDPSAPRPRYCVLDADAEAYAWEMQKNLFSRMASVYVDMFRSLEMLTKDLVLRHFPHLLSRALYLAYYRTLPYLRHLLTLEFRRYLLRSVSFWITGVEISDFECSRTAPKPKPQQATRGEISEQGEIDIVRQRLDSFYAKHERPRNKQHATDELPALEPSPPKRFGVHSHDHKGALFSATVRGMVAFAATIGSNELRKELNDLRREFQQMQQASDLKLQRVLGRAPPSPPDGVSAVSSPQGSRQSPRPPGQRHGHDRAPRTGTCNWYESGRQPVPLPPTQSAFRAEFSLVVRSPLVSQYLADWNALPNEIGREMKWSVV